MHLCVYYYRYAHHYTTLYYIHILLLLTQVDIDAVLKLITIAWLDEQVAWEERIATLFDR